MAHSMIAAGAKTVNSPESDVSGSDLPGSRLAAPSAESLLRGELARTRQALAAVPQVLAQLLASDHAGLFSEEVLAHTRGVLDSLAIELLREVDQPDGDSLARLTAGLSAEPALLAHCHGLALEWQLTEKLQRDLRIDPVLSALVQESVAAPEADRAALAMAVLAAQARFVQGQRRMQSSLAELPADLLHLALFRLVEACGERAGGAATALRSRHDEARSRAALLTRLLLALEPGFTAGIDPARGGIALFASALALATGLPRERVITAAAAGQTAVLATMLIAAGLDRSGAAQVLLALQPDVDPPMHCLSSDRAAAMAMLVGIVA